MDPFPLSCRRTREPAFASGSPRDEKTGGRNTSSHSPGSHKLGLLGWTAKDEYEQAKTLTILAEQEKEDAIRRGEAPHPNDIEDEKERKKHEPSPRLVRLWTKEPTPNRRRGHKRRALRLLVPRTRIHERRKNKQTGMYERKSILGRWQVPGLGPIELLSQNEIPADADVRSCHLVETTRAGTPLEKRRYALKVQCGHEVPESKGDYIEKYPAARSASASGDSPHLYRIQHPPDRLVEGHIGIPCSVRERLGRSRNVSQGLG